MPSTDAPFRRQEACEQGSQGGNCSGSDANGGFYYGPFNQINTLPGIVVCLCEVSYIEDANDCSGACTRCFVRIYGLDELARRTYKKPSERTKVTESFVLGFIFSPHTNEMGRIPKDQSVTALMAACIYVMSVRVLTPKQEPEPPSY
jgi:hypothetical protein